MDESVVRKSASEKKNVCVCVLKRDSETITERERECVRECV